MDYITAKNYFLSKPETIETYPFRQDMAVFKIKGKMFATLSKNGDYYHCNLKCDPDEALILRDIFTAVIPGYHMNKRHWNTLILDGSIPNGEIERMIDRSYGLVVKGLKKKQRIALEILHGLETIYR